MKTLCLVALTVLLVASTGAFAQTYHGFQPNVLGGGAAGTTFSVTGVVGIKGRLFEGRSADEEVAYHATTSRSVIGGGAVGSCNSAR